MHDTTRRSTLFYSWMFITQAFQNFYMIYRRFPKQARFPGRGGVWGVVGLIFAGFAAGLSQNACPVYSVANYRPRLSNF